MNYIMSFIACIACSVLTCLNGANEIKILLLSDFNVGLFLFLAYLINEYE